MNTLLHLSFRNMDHAASIERLVRDRLESLERLDARLVSCHATIEAMPHPGAPASHFHVTLALTLPGCELIVSRGSKDEHDATDALTAVRRAFDTLTRQLEEHHAKALATPH